MKVLVRVFAVYYSFLTANIWGGPFDDLNWRNPLPQGNDLWDVVYHRDKYFAVGIYGAVVTSRDGTNWATVPSRSRTALWGIASDGDQLVANGTPALLISRDDGITWEEVIPPQRMGNGIAYGNGVFVAGAEAGDLFTSINGRDWTKTFSFGGSQRISLAFGNGVMVALSAFGQVAISPNGFEWTTSACPSHMSSLDFADGRFISTDVISAGNSIWSSSNGRAWVKEHTMPQNQFLWAATSFEGKIIGVGDLIVRSDGGTNWISQPAPQGDYETLRDTLYRVRTGGGRVVAAGRTGSIFTSDDGVAWHAARSGTDFLLSRIVRGNGRFVIAGGAVTIVSSNGQSWSYHTNSYYRLEDLTFGRGKFLAAGVGYAPLLISSNGSDWSQTYISGIWHFMRAVAVGGETFLALGQQSYPVNGDEVTVVSADGENWTAWATPESRGLNTCTYGLGKFVAVGAAGKMGVSTNGSHWDIAAPLVATELNGVAASPTAFVAVGRSSTVLKSPDGLTWTAHDIGTNGTYYGITYGGGHFVALGETPRSTSLISVSSNGVDWMHYDTPVYPAALQKAAYGAGTFVLAGGYGVILQSGQINPYLSIDRSTQPGEVRLILRGDPGSYQIEYTDNPSLSSWSLFQNVQLTGESPTISTSAEATVRLYRAIFLGD